MSSRYLYLAVSFFVVFFRGYCEAREVDSSLHFQNDSLQFENYLKAASSSTDSAEYFFEKANQHVFGTFQVVTLARFWARHHYFQNNLEEAEIKVNEVVDRFSLESMSDVEKIELSHCYVLYDYILKRRGEYKLAVIQLNKAVSILEKIPNASAELADSYNNMGANYRRLEEYESAISWFRRALEKSSASKLLEIQIKAYGNLGLIHIDLHQTKNAKEYYHLILDLIEREDIGNEDIFRYLSHNNLGLALQAEAEFDSAIYHYNQALFEVKKMADSFNKNYTLGNVYGNLGVLSYQKGDLEEALRYSGQALNIFEKLLGNDHVHLLEILRNIGEASFARGEPEESRASLLRALSIGKANATDEVIGYNSLGDFHFKTQEFESAVAYYDSAVRKNQIFANNSISYTNNTLHFFSVRGKIEVELAREAPDVKIVLSLYDQLIGILTGILKNVENRLIVDECVATLEKIYRFFSIQHDLDERETWKNRLWKIMEINKAVKLKGQLKDQYSLSFSLPDSLLQRERNLKDSINIVLRGTKPNEFDSNLFVLNRAYEELIFELERSYPKYHELKNLLNVTPFVEAKVGLGENDILLNFFEGKERVFLIKVSNEKFEKFEFNKAELNQHIDQLNDAIFDSNMDRLLSSSDKILSLLKIGIKGIGFQNALIIPDGIIWKLNFSALAAKTEDGINFLGNTNTLIFNYYHDIRPDLRDPTDGSVLAFSYDDGRVPLAEDAYSNFRDLDQSIPGTSKEIVSISKIWKGDYYFGKRATESEFKEKGRKPGILHLATHGYQNERFPENSFLQFSSTDSINDGRLYSYEIYNLNLNAELAVLSACNSGRGKVVTGEGMMSMAQAFSYAGVKSTLASRWELPDISAPFLMKYFYEGLKKGMRKSEALKYAQIEFLKNDADNITSNPFYWSGLYIIGNDDPLTEDSSHAPWFVAALVIEALLFFLFWRSGRAS